MSEIEPKKAEGFSVYKAIQGLTLLATLWLLYEFFLAIPGRVSAMRLQPEYKDMGDGFFTAAWLGAFGVDFLVWGVAVIVLRVLAWTLRKIE